MDERAWALKYQPRILRDVREPFPIRYLGWTVFEAPGPSASFADLTLDPAAAGAERIIEYAIYYDYDIQHLYDLEHIWVAVGAGGEVRDCWSSFHGMRLRASGLRELFQVEETHPVLYAQPGKHAMMPDPRLFRLHPDFSTACGAAAGGGLLIPPMLEGKMWTDAEQDARIYAYIRERFCFEPSLEFIPEKLEEDQFIPWPELLERIPQLVAAQLEKIL